MADSTLQFNKRKFRGLSGNQIKMIAFFLMMCESVGALLILNGKLYAHNPMYFQMALDTAEGQRWYLAARILRFVGRAAFPLFAFFIVEGFRNTSSVGKYIFRMGFFALVSEVPFDLAYYGTVYYPEYQNVLITYFIALVALYCMSLAVKYPVLQVLIAAPFCYLAYLAKSDYGALGVALICVLYLLRREKKMQLAAGAVLSVAESYQYYGVSALAFFLLDIYNGTRGDAPLKYFFYIMYPLHLAAFYALVYFANR